MARPQALQFLRKGALLVGKIFPRFVETWNWLVGAFDSMVGDEDIDPKNGFISIDRKNPDRPIIRFNAHKLKNVKTDGGGIEDIRLSSDGHFIQVLVGGEWIDKIPTVQHSEV